MAKGKGHGRIALPFVHTSQAPYCATQRKFRRGADCICGHRDDFSTVNFA